MRQLVPWTLLFALSACVTLPGLPSEDDEANAGRQDDGRALGTTDGGEPIEDRSPDPDAPPVPPPLIINCFGAGTPIATPRGERPIEALAVGDPVWAFDTERGVRVRSVVTAVHRHAPAAVGKLTVADGRELRVTDEHPIYVPSLDRYLPAGELPEHASVLLLHDDIAAQLSSVATFERDFAQVPVFNITVADQHNYFAAGVLVHNKSPPPCPNYNWSTGTGCGNEVNPPPPMIPIETCFAPGTPIATPNGERAIEALRVGDEVWAFDLDSGKRITSQVTAVHHHAARPVGALTLSNGRSLRLTDNHPVYLPERGAFVPAGELTGDEPLLELLQDGSVRTLVADGFDADAGITEVHNLTVAGAHNYFAGGVLVHNKEAPPCQTYDWSSGTGCEHPVVGPAAECAPYPTAALSAEAYAERLNQYLAVTWFDAFAFPDLSNSARRNQMLLSLLTGMEGRVLAGALARLLRVPVPPDAGLDGDLPQQLAWQLLSDLGALFTTPEGATLPNLFGYTQSLLTPTLATFYGVSSFDPAAGSAQLLDWPSERSGGVLTEGAFLAAHPTPSDRGRVIQDLLMCGNLVPHTPPAPPPLLLGTRYDAYASLAVNPVCSQCHGVIDPIGLALEQFDESGSYRPTEGGQAVTPTGSVRNVAVTGPSELAQALLADPTLTETCLARAVLADALKRSLTPEDLCSVQWVVLGMQGRTDLRGALLSAITSTAFLHEPP